MHKLRFGCYVRTQIFILVCCLLETNFISAMLDRLMIIYDECIIHEVIIFQNEQKTSI